MVIRWGKCVNRYCEDARRGELTPVPDGEPFVCPACGQTLVDENAAKKRPGPVAQVAPAALQPFVEPPPEPAAPMKKQSSPIPLIAGALLLVLILGGGGFLLWNRMHGATGAVEVDPHMTILRLAGSNTIGDELAPALAVAFLKEQGATNVETLAGGTPDEKVVQGVLPGNSAPSFITIAAHGSTTAFTAMAEQSCDIGMSSRRIKPDEASKLALLGDMLSPASEHVVGLDGIAVIISPSNLVDKLSRDQIKGIFTGDISDWSKVGTSHGTIRIYTRNDNSGTYDTFKNDVLAGSPLAQEAQKLEDSKALSEAVTADPNGIGFVGLPYILGAKDVAVFDKGTTPLLPTRLTVATEDYILSRRLYFYTPARPANRYTRMFVEFVASKHGQDVVGNVGFATQNLAQMTGTAPDDAPPEYKQLTKGASRLSVDFRFQPGQTTLDSKATADLDRVVSLAADQGASGDKVMLFGFSDNVGDAGLSQAQALARAKAVEAELVQRGLKPATVRGFGSKLPVASSDTEEGQDKNRRVEIWIKK